MIYHLYIYWSLLEVMYYGGVNGEGDQIIEDLRLFNIIKIILIYKLHLF